MRLQSFVIGFIIGCATGVGVASLFWRRQTSGTMPSPLFGFVLGLVIGLGAGLATTIVFGPRPLDQTLDWLLSVMVGATAILWGSNLAVRVADRLLSAPATAEAA